VKENINDKTEEFYEIIQMPVLVGLLFFIFQLPFIRKNLFIHLPSLFNKDGNPNLSGYLFNSVIFALLYFSFTYILKYISV
jgi:membrane protein insertase Oxa1/YidC/SpoIIIJ